MVNTSGVSKFLSEMIVDFERIYLLTLQFGDRNVAQQQILQKKIEYTELASARTAELTTYLKGKKSPARSVQKVTVQSRPILPLKRHMCLNLLL